MRKPLPKDSRYLTVVKVPAAALLTLDKRAMDECASRAEVARDILLRGLKGKAA
jgi:hypothetical protein